MQQVNWNPNVDPEDQQQQRDESVDEASVRITQSGNRRGRGLMDSDRQRYRYLLQNKKQSYFTSMKKI